MHAYLPLARGRSYRLEILAMHLADEIGVHKVPTQVLVKRDSLGSVNVQSMIQGVRPVLIKGWEQCLQRNPRRNTTGKGPRSGRSPRATRVVHVNPMKTFTFCYENNSIDRWKYPAPEHPCLTTRPLQRKCNDGEIAQILEMMIFDTLIVNRDRIKPGLGSSNNVHVVSAQLNGLYDAWKMLWIDNGHMTFERGPQRELLDFFATECVFPSNFAEVLLEPAAGDLSLRVMKRMNRSLIVDLDKILGAPNKVVEKVAIVGEQLKALQAVATKCATENPDGALNVMTLQTR